MIELTIGSLVTLAAVFLSVELARKAERKRKSREREDLAKKLYGILLAALANLKERTGEIDPEISNQRCPTLTMDVGALDYFRKEATSDIVDPETLDQLNTLIVRTLGLNRHIEILGEIYASRGPCDHFTAMLIQLGPKRLQVHNLANDIFRGVDQSSLSSDA